MAKNGYRIFDSDTHVGPSMDILEPYLDPARRASIWYSVTWTANVSSSTTWCRQTRARRRGSVLGKGC